MNGAECSHRKTDVIDSRPSKNGIYRRRKCRACSARFTTVEVPAELVRGRSGGLVPTKDIPRVLELEQKLRQIRAIISVPDSELEPQKYKDAGLQHALNTLYF